MIGWSKKVSGTALTFKNWSLVGNLSIKDTTHSLLLILKRLLFWSFQVTVVGKQSGREIRPFVSEAGGGGGLSVGSRYVLTWQLYQLGLSNLTLVSAKPIPIPPTNHGIEFWTCSDPNYVSQDEVNHLINFHFNQFPPILTITCFCDKKNPFIFPAPAKSFFSFTTANGRPRTSFKASTPKTGSKLGPYAWPPGWPHSSA